MREKEEAIVYVEKTCRVDVEGKGTRLKVGDIYLRLPHPGPRLEDFADAAFKSARASLNKLMVPDYVLIVIDGSEEARYGLGRWIKLRDGTKDNVASPVGKKKTPIHKRGVAV